MVDINGYALSRAWFAYVSENRDKVKPTHTSLFFWCVELWNKLGQPASFGLPTSEAQHHSCLSSHTTFATAINDLIDWGFISVKQKSKNQYTANVISVCLPKNWQSNLKANEKQSIEQVKSTVDIIEPNNTINNKEGVKDKTKTKKFIIPEFKDVGNYMFAYANKTKELNVSKEFVAIEAEAFINHNQTTNWIKKGEKMKDWQAAVRTWVGNWIRYGKLNNPQSAIQPIANKPTVFLGED